MGTFQRAFIYGIGILACAFILSMPAHAKTNILLIVDGSNSMWGQIDKTAKVETARKTLSKLISDLPKDADLALMAYGHTREGDCNDVELLSAMGKDKPEMITTLIHTIQPTGKTPIANALTKAKDAFKGLEGQNNHVLLVSDGIESCNGDPCAVAKSLQEAGLNVSAHVVGFGVSKEEGKQLTCIAENTGGKYFEASDTAAFNEAIEEVTQLAQAEPVAETPPPPAEPEPTLWLEDNFDGDDLAEHWEVINPDPDNYIVENGELMMIASKHQILTEGTVANIIRLNKDLPKGDWRATIKLNIDWQTGWESGFFGLYDDKDNYMLDQLYVKGNGAWGDMWIEANREKVIKGDLTRSTATVWTTKVKGKDNTNYILMEEPQPILLRYEKKGRSYSTSIKMENAAEPKWVPLPDLKLLRQKGNLAIGLYQYSKDARGETTMLVDWVKIETMEKPEENQPAAGE